MTIKDRNTTTAQISGVSMAGVGRQVNIPGIRNHICFEPEGKGGGAPEEGNEETEGGNEEAEGGDEDGDEGGDEDGDDEGDKEKTSAREAELLKESMKRKKALKERDGKIAELEGELRRFEGIDPDAVKKLIAEQKTAEEKALEKKGEWDTLRKRMAEEHAKNLSEKDDEIKALRDRLNNADTTINDLTVGQAFESDQYSGEKLVVTPRKARIIYGDHFDVKDGKVVGYDKPRGAAERTEFVDASGDPLPFTDVIQKLVDADPDRDTLLRASLRPGSDSRPNTGKPKPVEEEVRGVGRIEKALSANNK